MEKETNSNKRKKILITGANSYIGTSFEHYVHKHYPDAFQVDTVDMIDGIWREKDFSSYDTIFHVAGIAHADTTKVSEATKQKYYAVNTDLAIETAKKAKAEGVKQFIYMSSIIVYGASARVGENKVITKDTITQPENFYGDSKLKAEKGLKPLSSDTFKVVILRPPMIYGRGSKGNYPKLAQMAQKLPAFPYIKNQRSMLYIENLCEFIKQRIDAKDAGTFFPQNTNYVNTSVLVKLIAKAHGKDLKLVPGFSPSIKMMGRFTELANKAFGSLTYDKSLSGDLDAYNVASLGQSVARTEFTFKKYHHSEKKTVWIIDHYASEPQYGGISRQYDFGSELSKRGYNVIVIASAFSHFKHEYITNEKIAVSSINPNFHFVYIHTTKYENNDGKERAINMVSFFKNVMYQESDIAEKLGKPDVVTGCSVHPLAWIAAYKISKKYKARFCVEVRDLWPEMWLLGGIKTKNDPMVIFFGMLEKWAYQKADRIIYSMDYGDKYICDKLGFDRKKCFLIGQPMDCERFDNNAKTKVELIPENIRDFMNDSFVCVFTGYYMSYEGVYVMLKAAKKMQENHYPVKMVFVGSGEEEQDMRNFVNENQLSNVLIGSRISKEAIPALLKSSDICMAHLAIPEHLEAYKYGVSKNKINEYLYAGNCILYGFTEQKDIVSKSGAGYIFEPFNAEELYEDIITIYKMPVEERKQFGLNGRNFIEHNRSVSVLVDRMENVLFGKA